VHVDEAREDKAARKIVDEGAGGCAVAAGGKHSTNAGAFYLDDAIGLHGAADDIDDRDVIEDQQRECEHFSE